MSLFWSLLKVGFLALLFVALIPAVIVGYLLSDGWLHRQQYQLWVVPDALHVAEIIYEKEESWGFGPGGNETGLLIYHLPDDVANAIQEQGIAYLQNLPPNVRSDGRDWRGDYWDWKETPIPPNDIPLRPSTETTLNNKDDYPVFYGFGITITRDASAVYNQAMQQAGNYYAKGRIGTIIVAPSIRRVIYAYDS